MAKAKEVIKKIVKKVQETKKEEVIRRRGR